MSPFVIPSNASPPKIGRIFWKIVGLRGTYESKSSMCKLIECDRIIRSLLCKKIVTISYKNLPCGKMKNSKSTKDKQT